MFLPSLTYTVNRPLDQAQLSFHNARQFTDTFQCFKRCQMQMKKDSSGMFYLKSVANYNYYGLKYYLTIVPQNNEVTCVKLKPYMALNKFSSSLSFIMILYIVFFIFPHQGIDFIGIKILAVMLPIIYIAFYCTKLILTYKNVYAFMKEYISAINQEN